MSNRFLHLEHPETVLPDKCLVNFSYLLSSAAQCADWVLSTWQAVVVWEEETSDENMPPLVGRSSPLWAVLCVGKVYLEFCGKAMGSEPVSSVSPWPLLQSLPPGSFPDIL